MTIKKIREWTTARKGIFWCCIAVLIVMIYLLVMRAESLIFSPASNSLLPQLQKYAPDISQSNIYPSEMDGISELYFNEKLHYLIDEKYIFVGEVYRISDRTNMTKKSIEHYAAGLPIEIFEKTKVKDDKHKARISPQSNYNKTKNAVISAALESQRKKEDELMQLNAADPQNSINPMGSANEYASLILAVQKELGRELSKEEVVNLIRVSIANNGIPSELATIYPAKIDERMKITVFADITCPFCVKLHSVIPELQAQGITVRYLLFPRHGLKHPSAEIMAKVSCVAPGLERQNTLDRAFKGDKLLDKNSCGMEYISASLALTKPGEEGFGIESTPTILADNGIRLNGIPRNSDKNIDLLLNALKLQKI